MSDPETSDIEALRVTREESRIALEHQIAMQKDLDEKALRTVRLSLVLLALIVSVAPLMDPDRVTSLDIETLLSVAAGVLALSITVFIGLGVYVETDVPVGIGPGHRRVQTQAYTEREWLDVLLDEYDDWTDDATASNDLNALWLSRARFRWRSALATCSSPASPSRLRYPLKWRFSGARFSEESLWCSTTYGRGRDHDGDEIGSRPRARSRRQGERASPAVLQVPRLRTHARRGRFRGVAASILRVDSLPSFVGRGEPPIPRVSIPNRGA